MSRPKKIRFVCQKPYISKFYPDGNLSADEVFLSIEGYEAIRLVDFEGMDQEQAAEAMNVSRPTLSRILAQARSAVAEALVLGKTLRIEGGNYELCPLKRCAHRRRRRFRGGRG